MADYKGPQGDNYLSHNIGLNTQRYINARNDVADRRTRLGDRTLYSQNLDGKRYYSSLDAEIYFGNTYIDDLVQITWAVEQATMPLFGYNSFTFDDLAVGSRQVQGSFVVNFTKARFMYDVLQEIGKNGVAVNRSTLNTPEALNKEEPIVWDSYWEKEHKPSWNRSFNIMIGYGDYNKNKPEESGYNTSAIILYCVQLTGCQQVMGVDGAPIAEAYSFIARDIRYDEKIDEKPTLTEQKETTDEKTLAIDNAFAMTIENMNLTKKPGYNVDKNIMDATDVGRVSATYYNDYTFNADFKYGGGTITNILVTFKRSTSTVINSTAFSVGTSSPINYGIPSEASSVINKEIQSQKAMGATQYYLLVDMTIIYEKDGVAQSPYYIHNKKVYLTQ